MARNRDRKRRRGGQDANGHSPVQLTAAEAPALDTAQIDPAKEYVSGVYHGSYPQWLPARRVERLAPEITFETYKIMLNDPEIVSDVRTLTQMALADGIQITPAVSGHPVDVESSDSARAQEIAAFVERNFRGLSKPLEDSLSSLVEGAITYGHKVAEVTWKAVEKGPDRGKLMLDRIAAKCYDSLDFVLDKFSNLLGFTPRHYSSTFNVESGKFEYARPILPREKFCLLSLHEEDEDPRGRSSIRPAFNGWNFKQMTWPEYFRWLENCALPSVVGKTAPRQAGDVQRNADGTAKAGGKPTSAAEAMRDALLNLKNASVAVLPNGAEVDQLEVVGEGAGFERAINVADSQITKAILFQTLATNEAQFGTRAQSQTHMQVLDLLVWWLKGKIAAMIKADLVKQIIIYNFGEASLQFAPIVSLGDTERRDWSKDATAAASLSPVITESQWLAITNQLGLPAPRPGEKPRGAARQANQPQQQTAKLDVQVSPDRRHPRRGYHYASEVGPMGDPL
jgi:uncharacterized protein DUF935